MTLTLLAQALIAGVLTGGLYGLMALGLSMSWGLLRLVNISLFALAFLSAYLTYQLGSVSQAPLWLSVALLLPSFFFIGVAMHWLFLRFKVAEMASMLVTFGLALFIESMIQWWWTADFRKFESGYSESAIKVGPLFISTLELIAFIVAAALSAAMWAWLRWTFVGRALRAAAQDPAIAAAFGVDGRRLSFILAGLCTALAAIAGIFIALTATLSPSEIGSWIGVVFAVVIIGGLGNPIGALLAGMLIGVSESITMALVNPAWAPLVSFTILIALLLRRPRWI